MLPDFLYCDAFCQTYKTKIHIHVRSVRKALCGWNGIGGDCGSATRPELAFHDGAKKQICGMCRRVFAKAKANAEGK